MIAQYMKELMGSRSASAIRRMFEEGIALKKVHGEENVFDFSLGNPDLDPPEKVLAAIEEVARDRAHGVHGYMPNAGYGWVRDEMARKVSSEQGVEVGGQNVVMTVGAASALNCVLKAVVNPGDEVVVPAPFFAEYRNYVRNHGGVLVEVPPGDGFSLDVRAIGARLTERTAAVLINSPNNPTGRVYRRGEIEALAEVLRKHAESCSRAPLLVCDEPYRAITYDGAVVAPAFQCYDDSVVVTSFAKDLSLPGERLGYVAVSPRCSFASELVGAVTFSLRVLGCVNAPAFFQKVVAKSWDAEVDYSSYERRRDLLMGILDRVGIEYARPEGAFYLFCKVPGRFSGGDAEFCDLLKKHLVLCAPGAGFGGPGWFRLAYCVPESTIVNSERAFRAAVAEIG